MALHSLTEEGHMGWDCPMCGTSRSAHVSHEEVQFHLREGHPIHHRTVGLPACACGTRTFLKVDFTAEELATPNMIDEQGQPTESHAMAQRHRAVVQHLEAVGKLHTTEGA